ncbi:50S ribosomal protein L19 [Candidatus Parcubacteria bacterium]|nr:50S ribosomal protein L19 [Candidatus Parcubacteria bacterium]MBI4099318.1 50S ribosomal protein L19 [Candidatus Parcubacteria bacterium]MBI4385227.1 50S ribosomal protein L19 [Candidatus Parcubacteria bacterium]
MTPVTLAEQQIRTDLPDLKPGDTVRVWQKIKEGDKERLQAFEGVLIARHRKSGASATFTVRRIISGIGVERVFPLHSPAIDKIEVVKRAKVRRAKLTYLRLRAGKAARMREAATTPASTTTEG